jgi:hypothetical protein
MSRVKCNRGPELNVYREVEPDYGYTFYSKHKDMLSYFILFPKIPSRYPFGPIHVTVGLKRGTKLAVHSFFILAPICNFPRKNIGNAQTHGGRKIWGTPEHIWDVNVFWASPIFFVEN